jgi:hypothetical protein
MWTKRDDHAARSGCADFFNISPKRVVLGNIKVWSFFCLLLSFTCLHSLLNVSKMWLANFLTSISKKNARFNLYMFNVIYKWHVPCVVTTISRIFSVWLNLILLPQPTRTHRSWHPNLPGAASNSAPELRVLGWVMLSLSISHAHVLQCSHGKYQNCREQSRAHSPTPHTWGHQADNTKPAQCTLTPVLPNMACTVVPNRHPERWAGSKIEGLLSLFWGPTLHIPNKIFCNPSKRKG